MTDSETQHGYVRRQIQERLQSMRSSMNWYRTRHFHIQISSIVLSALITIVAGFKLINPSTFFESNVILILGAVTTTVTAFGAIYSPRESWHLTADAYSQLRALEAKLLFQERSAEFNQNEKQIVTQIFTEYQAILERYNQGWQQLRQKPKS